MAVQAVELLGVPDTAGLATDVLVVPRDDGGVSAGAGVGAAAAAAAAARAAAGARTRDIRRPRFGESCLGEFADLDQRGLLQAHAPACMRTHICVCMCMGACMDACNCMLTTRYLLPPTSHFPPPTSYLLLTTTHCSLLTAHYSLLTYY